MSEPIEEGDMNSRGFTPDDPIALATIFPNGGCFGTGGGLDTLVGADGDGGVIMGGCFDPDSMGLEDVVGSALDSAVNNALGSLLAVNDETPAGEAIAKTLLSKYKDQIKELLEDPAALMKKFNELFVGITSSANVPIGMAFPTAGPVVLVQNLPAMRLADKLFMTKEVDVGPLVQGNPTVILNGMPAAGKGHLAIGVFKGTLGEPKLVAATVLMGTATVTDMSIYENAKEKAAETAPRKAAAGNGQSSAQGSKEATPSQSPQPPPGKPDPKLAKEAAEMAYTANVGDRTADGKMVVTDVTEDPATGFRAITLSPLQCEAGEPEMPPIVGLAGTNDIRMDVPVDLSQATDGIPEQYRQAAEYAKNVKEQYGVDPYLAGHSLGGGMTTYAAGMNNLDGATVNSARLGAGTMDAIGRTNPDYDFNRLNHYRNQFDPVSDPHLRGSLPGNHHIIEQDPSFGMGPVGRTESHLLGNVHMEAPTTDSDEAPMTPGNTGLGRRLKDSAIDQLKTVAQQLSDLVVSPAY